jgi:hypothetical protein
MKTRWVLWLIIPCSFAAFGQGTVNFANVNSGAGLDAPIFGTDGTTKLQRWTVELLAGPTLDSLVSVATTGFLTQAPGYFNGGVVSIPNVPSGSKAWCVVCAYSPIPFDAPYNLFYGASAPFQVVLGGGFGSGPPGLPTSLAGLSSFDLALRLRSRPTSTNKLSLTWEGFPGGLYQLEASPDLNPGHWVAFTNAPNVQGFFWLGKFSVSIPAPQGSMFYRLVQFPGPN